MYWWVGMGLWSDLLARLGGRGGGARLLRAPASLLSQSRLSRGRRAWQGTRRRRPWSAGHGSVARRRAGGGAPGFGRPRASPSPPRSPLVPSATQLGARDRECKLRRCSGTGLSRDPVLAARTVWRTGAVQDAIRATNGWASALSGGKRAQHSRVGLGRLCPAGQTMLC